MNSLRNYSKFNQDITFAFGEVISKFHFKLIEIEEGVFELNNGKCLIAISYDRGVVLCFLNKPESVAEQKGYLLWSVYKYLYPNDRIDTDLSEAHLQLKNLAVIAEEKLKNILLGDFSWVQDYEKDHQQLKKMVGYVNYKIDKKHSIYLKFMKNDQSWISDLKKYLVENKIDIN
jgi:hypothetical protein